MELRVMHYFLTVVYEENITSAAEKLHITQPTLSRQMMQLEEELGVQLFRRGKRKIALTSEGLLLKRRAEEILDLMNRAKKGLLDICLLTEPVDVEKFDFIRIPQKEKWGVLMRKDSPLAGQRRDVREHPRHLHHDGSDAEGLRYAAFDRHANHA